MHKHIRGILWGEQPAPETVHRGTKVAPEWRLDGYVWKPSLWKSSLSSLIPRPRPVHHRLVNAVPRKTLMLDVEKRSREIIAILCKNVIFRGEGFS